MSIVTLTESAQAQIEILLDRIGYLETHGFRLQVIGGGCSGLQYKLGFDDYIGDSDNEFSVGKVKIIIDDKSAVYLAGCTVDYSDTLQESGFNITNPNSNTTCGCGQSFGV